MNLNFFTSLATTGYGIAGYNIAKQLISSGVNLSISIPGKHTKHIAEDFQDLKTLVENSIYNYDINAPYIKLWHQHDLESVQFTRSKYYAWPIFELDIFTPYEVANLNIPDELIVCSQWAKEIVDAHVNKKVSVVPLGVDREIFKPQQREDNENYVFFNIGKLEIRKGHDILPRLFSKAFEKKDKVELRLLVNNIFLSAQEMSHYINQVKSTKLGDRIHFSPVLPNSQSVADFINRGDCGIFISHAEGWGMESLETLSCGKPHIVTDYSAHTEYCNSDNSYLVDITEKEYAYDGKWFFNQGKWASIGYDQEEQIIEHMRHCYNNRPDNPNGILTAERFTWNHTATKLLNLIQ